LGSRSFKVEVNPKVLRWARESSGYSLLEVATYLEIADRTLAHWETGNRLPTLDALNGLAKLYKRSVAVLLLPHAPTEPSPPTDFRQLPDSKAVLSPKTRIVIRTARWLVERATELETELGVRPSTIRQQVTLADDPEVLATAFRSQLDITVQQQAAFRGVGHAFREWRELLEHLGFFVFQFPMPADEALGFSVAGNGKGAIVVNRSDPIIARRIFTLFHECGHLLLAKPGVCFPDEGQVLRSESVETFCNRFAAALLIPHTEAEQLRRAIHDLGEADAAEHRASHYHVSRYVVLGRMRSLGLIPQETYKKIAQKWIATGTRRKARKGGRGESAVEKCMNQRGRRLAKSVLDGAERNLITTTEAMRYLNVKLADLATLRSKVRQASG